MRTPSHRTILLLGLICGAASCAPAEFCTLLDCGTSVTTSASVASTLADLEGATVTICRNTDCADTKLVSTAVGASLRCDFSSPAVSSPRDCGVSEEGAGNVLITLSFRVTESDAPQDGDQFTFQVKSKSDPNNLLVDKQGSVTYEVSQPNGDSCEPSCYSATL